MHAKLKELTKNRLKRASFNHLSKQLHRCHEDLLPSSPAEMEMLKDFEEEHLDNVSVVSEVPGIGTKDRQAPHLMNDLTLEMIEDRYNPMEWTHAFTDGCSEGAVKNGGGGVFIRHTDGRLTPRTFPTGKISSNSRAEAASLLHAAKVFTRTASQ